MSATGSWTSAIYCTKACQPFRNKCGFHLLFGILEKRSTNQCQSGERCLFMRLNHELQVADWELHWARRQCFKH